MHIEGHVALHEGKKRFPNEKLSCNAHFLKLNPFAPGSDYHYIPLITPESHIDMYTDVWVYSVTTGALA